MSGAIDRSLGVIGNADPVDFDRLVGPGSPGDRRRCGPAATSFAATRRRQRSPSARTPRGTATSTDAQGDARRWQRLPNRRRAKSSSGMPLRSPIHTTPSTASSPQFWHIPDDDAAIAELVRVLKPGGTLAVTVRGWLPRTDLLATVRRYHANEAAHASGSTGPTNSDRRSPTPD